jgi:uncharacterized repeat protein (TIGR01451 family)
MHDVAMRRRLAASVIAALFAVLVVSGAMLFGMGKPAQSQESAPPCNTNFCLDKTADPSTVTVGERITFTITERCAEANFCNIFLPLVDELPSGLTVNSVDPVGPLLPSDYQCSTSGNTVTCPGDRSSTQTQPFTLTIVATPTECGSFTNTATNDLDPSIGFYTVEAAFTVEGCVPVPTTKAQCKKGGWKDFGYPNQGTCISDVNRRNR